MMSIRAWVTNLRAGAAVVGSRGLGSTWRFMGSYKWSYKSPNMGYNYSFRTYNPTYSYP